MSVGPAPGQAGALLALLRRTGAVSECVVRGGSMGRAIPDGAEVRIHFDGGAGAREGDAVALLLADDALTVHRLHARGQGRGRGLVITVGDANLFPDAPLREDAVLGTVTGMRTTGGAWASIPADAEGPITRGVRTATSAVLAQGVRVHPAIGVALKGLFVAMMWPVVQLNPYAAGRSAASARFGRP